MIKYEVIPATSEVYLVFENTPFGKCKFWMPEGIATPRGLAGVYPRGMCWIESSNGLSQKATLDQVFGPGNVKEIEPVVLECCGIRCAKEPGLPWTSSIKFGATRVDFSLAVYNPHDVALPDVCAPLCFKFMDAAWWNPASCFFSTEKGIQNISQTGWIEGRFPSFQKWQIGPDTPYDNPAMNGIWTTNPVRATSPTWVIQHEQTGSAIVFSCESAYYIHCNKNNPCTDIALKLGEIGPRQTTERSGCIELTKGTAEALFNQIGRPQSDMVVAES
jgi:hypothetical protein